MLTEVRIRPLISLRSTANVAGEGEYNMTIHSYTIIYQPDTDTDYEYPAGIMAISAETGETLFVGLPEDHPAAPVGHDQTVVDEITEFFEGMKGWLVARGRGERAELIDDPLDHAHHIHLEPNPEIEADDLDTGTITLLSRHVLEELGYVESLYQTFCIVYRVSEYEGYPLAIFAQDVSGGGLEGMVIGKPNPYLPRFSRQQRRAIDREMTKFARKFVRGDIQGAFAGLDRPRFGVFTIDDYRAVSPEHAVEQAVADLDEIHFGAAGRGEDLAS